jgi:bacteriocin-like protein
MSDNPSRENPEELSQEELDQVSGGAGLESQDRMGNFEIQDLMSSFNQAETVASSVQKKRDDTAKSILNKI